MTPPKLILLLVVSMGLYGIRAAEAAGAEAAPVTVAETAETYTLSNGIVTADVSKHSGGLMSLKYRGLDILDPNNHGTPGYWSHAATAPKMIEAITIDPKAN